MQCCRAAWEGGIFALFLEIKRYFRFIHLNRSFPVYEVYNLDISYMNAVSIYGQFVCFTGLNFLPEAVAYRGGVWSV